MEGTKGRQPGNVRAAVHKKYHVVYDGVFRC